jgi:hypothetical protein
MFECVLGLALIGRTTGIRIESGPALGSYRKYMGRAPVTFSFSLRKHFHFNSRSSLFFEPALAVFTNPDNVSFGQLSLSVNGSSPPRNQLIYSHLNSIGLLLGGGVGKKFWFKKTQNYLVVDVNYMQGLTRLEKLYSPAYVVQGTSFEYETVNRGSHFSLRVSFGFQPLGTRKEKEKLSDASD